MSELVTKGASVSEKELTDVDLKKIGCFSMKELTADDVFAFKVAICDNEVDREFEVFPSQTLKRLAEMYIGKTVISNHDRKTENQCARIYDTYIENANGTTKAGEQYQRLVACCYMARTPGNADLISEIEAGIKKEVSVCCAIGDVKCSICGADNRKTFCEHYGGREYDGNLCYFRLERPKDAYEVSFVAVPAQPNAGVTKEYGGAKPKGKKTTDTDLVELEMELAKSFIFAEKERMNEK